jgi:adenosylmethionine-8-amino-7-oxononanoate aminotransferase
MTYVRAVDFTLFISLQMEIPESLILPFSGGRHTEDPIVVESGEGAYLTDVTGRRYLDGFSALWTAILGYQHPVITEAIRKQVEILCHATLYGQAHRPAIELTEKLLPFLDLPGYSVLYAHSGSEAVEAAIKVAVNYWSRVEENSPRKRILTFTNTYHGETSAAMTASGFDSHQQLFPGMVSEKLEAQSPVAMRIDQGSQAIVKPDFKKLIDRHEKEIAAVIIEPVYGAGGVLFPNKDFLLSIDRACKERDLLLIVDEVATGYYRTGPRFCFQDLGIKPDLLVLGKAMTAGHLPLAATLLSPKLTEEYSRKNGKTPLFHGHTFSGNPLSCRAAEAAIDVLSSPQQVLDIERLSAYFKARVSELSHPLIAEIRCRGLFAGVELFDGRREGTDWSLFAHEICNELKRRGVLLRPLGNVLVLAPSAAFSTGDVDFLIDELKGSIQVVSKKTHALK